MGTIRQDIIDLLSHDGLTALEISQAVGIGEKDVYRHLVHVQKTMAGRGGHLAVSACRCLACGFIFKTRRRLTRPGRCPRCRQSRIDHPVFRVEN